MNVKYLMEFLETVEDKENVEVLIEATGSSPIERAVSVEIDSLITRNDKGEISEDRKVLLIQTY